MEQKSSVTQTEIEAMKLQIELAQQDTAALVQLNNDHAVKSEELTQSMRKKMSGLHKRVKSDIEENFGRFKADLGLLQSDQKVTAEKIEQTEQLIERLKANNSNGIPMAQSPRAEEQKKMAKHLK